MNLFKNEINHHNNKIFQKTDEYQTFIGFLIYLLVFVIMVPYILLKNKYYLFMGVYMPNVDLIANLLSWHQGILPMWKNIYKPFPNNNIEFFTQTTINYIALLGITFIILREAKKNDIAYGLSLGFTMFLLTYLLPSKIINKSMQKIHDISLSIINNINHDDIDNDKKHSIAHTIAFLFGTILTILIILFERMIIKYFGSSITHLSKNIISLPKMI